MGGRMRGGEPRRVSAVRRRSALASAAMLVIASGSVFFASPASAWQQECGRFFGGDPSLNYRYYGVTQSYRDAFNQAQYSWDTTSAPGTFYENSTDTDPHVEVRDFQYSWGDWARTTWTCGVVYWLNNEVYIDFNTGTMASLSAREKKIVAIHELGHAYGLAHEYYTCSYPGPATMRPGQGKFACAGDGPWYDDVLGVQTIY